MKFFIDLSKKQLVKSAASNVAHERLVLKRRDSLAIEVVFVSRNAVASMPAGTTTTVALKKTFADSNFLALASGEPPTLNLNTVPIEASFSSNPASVSALLEIRWSVPGETTRTATVQAEIQNSVILGTEQTPAAIPDGKATQAEATTGTDNTKWMTPLRTAQAIAQLAPPPTWDSVLNKPATFPATAHTHLKGEITGLTADLAALTTADTALGQRIDFLAANLDPAALDSIAEAAASIGSLQTQINGKAATVHTHAQSEITGLTTALAGKQPIGSYATATQGAKADTASQPGHVHGSNEVKTTALIALNFWESESAVFYRVPFVFYNGQPLYQAEPDFTLWYDSNSACWNISNGQPFTENVVATSDEANGLLPHLVPWAFDLDLANVGDLTDDLRATFATVNHKHPANTITGLSAFVAASAPGLSIVTTTHIADGLRDTYSVSGLASADPSHVLVSLNGVTQNPGVDYMVNLASGTIVFDDYPASGQQIVFTALGLRSVQRPLNPTLYIYAFDQSANGLTTYSGRLLNADRPAAPALPETASTWTIRRTTLNAAGRVLSTASANGSWANRETLAFA